MNAWHPSDDVLRLVLDEHADAQTDEDVTSHLDECEYCQTRIEQFAESSHGIRESLRRETMSGSLALDTPKLAKPSETAWLADFAVSFLQPTDQPDAIGKLGEFEVQSVIGHGGMGIVLKGFQPELNRPVAIKVMSPHLASIGTARKRFLREAQATAAIVHPNVMPILSVSESATLPYLVMPYVACRTLQQRIDTEGPLPITDVLRIGIQVAAAL
ncbi:serine/threonine-protein kinase, partial [Rhodopirellula bahusiensis]